MTTCPDILSKQLQGPWSRGRTAALLSLGTVFDDPRERKNIFPSTSSPSRCFGDASAPLGAGDSVIAPLPERLPGLIEG